MRGNGPTRYGTAERGALGVPQNRKIVASVGADLFSIRPRGSRRLTKRFLAEY